MLYCVCAYHPIDTPQLILDINISPHKQKKIMKKQINIVSANPGNSGVELVFTTEGSTEFKTSIVAGPVFESVLKGANLPNIPATYRNINGALAIAEVVDAKAGESFVGRDGATGTYTKDHTRLNNLAIINGAVIYGRLTMDEVVKDNALFSAKTVEFTPKTKNVLGMSFAPPTPIVKDEVVEESEPQDLGSKSKVTKPAEKVLETNP